MDTIFHKTKNIFTLVWTAKHEPHRYGKNGEVLIDYEETKEHQRRASTAERRASVLSQDKLDPEKEAQRQRDTYRGNPGGPAPFGA